MAHAATEQIVAVVAEALQAFGAASPGAEEQAQAATLAEKEPSPAPAPTAPSSGPQLHAGLRPVAPVVVQPPAEVLH